MSSLYIGLGGSGIDAVKDVFERNKGNEVSCSKDEFLLIDTDVHSRSDLPEVLQRSFIEIGAKSPTQIKEEALNSPQKEWFLNWYDYDDSDHSLLDGTGTVRPYACRNTTRFIIAFPLFCANWKVDLLQTSCCMSSFSQEVVVGQEVPLPWTYCI